MHTCAHLTMLAQGLAWGERLRAQPEPTGMPQGMGWAGCRTNQTLQLLGQHKSLYFLFRPENSQAQPVPALLPGDMKLHHDLSSAQGSRKLLQTPWPAAVWLFFACSPFLGHLTHELWSTLGLGRATNWLQLTTNSPPPGLASCMSPF